MISDRECEDLTSPELGVVTLTGRMFGDRATYSCDHGFHLVGLKERTCQADGSWSGQPPACKQNSKILILSLIDLIKMHDFYYCVVFQFTVQVLQ